MCFFLSCELNLLFCFAFVRENNVKNAPHAPAMASFELGMCYRAMKDASMAKKWLKKSHTKYTGNFAEPMISFRAQLALESLKKINDTNSEE